MKHSLDINDILHSLPHASQGPLHIKLDADTPLTGDQIISALIDQYGNANQTIDRDPDEQLKFAQKLLDHQGELLELCWSMRERLDLARDCVSGFSAWTTLIDETIQLTAQLQLLADQMRSLGETLKKSALRLIEQRDAFHS